MHRALRGAEDFRRVNVGLDELGGGFGEGGGGVECDFHAG